MAEGGGPASENKAGIYSRLHSKQGEAQWTQGPDRDTDTLPRITGHGPATLCGQSLCCFRKVGLFWAAIITPLPSALPCAQAGADCFQAPPIQSSPKCWHQTQTCVRKWNINNHGAVDLLRCAAVARNHWWVSVSLLSLFLTLQPFSLSLYFHSPNHTLEMCVHCTR